jgi:hypothetical protein
VPANALWVARSFQFDLYFALIENRSFLTSKNSGSQFNRSINCGYLHTPVTGLYRFWLSAGNAAQFRLSTDEEPLNANTIIMLAEASGYRRFDRFPTAVQRSPPIYMEAGRRYYFEAILTDPSGRGSLSVAWNIPATGGRPGEVRKIIADRYLSPIEPVAPPLPLSSVASLGS